MRLLDQLRGDCMAAAHGHNGGKVDLEIEEAVALMAVVEAAVETLEDHEAVDKRCYMTPLSEAVARLRDLAPATERGGVSL